jgi:selenocysteine-specific elongation factor
VDRAFTITGSGTVVTGTLAAGSLRQGDRLHLLGHGGAVPVVVRGMHSRNMAHTALEPCTRVALNLRGVSASDVHRGDALVTPGTWPLTDVLDVRRSTGPALTDTAEHLVVHAGTAAVPARLSPFDDDHARLVLDRPLPLVLGDRLVLRDPGSRSVLGGAQVLDADPPALRRRGDRARRAVRLAGTDLRGDVGAEVARRGAVQAQHLHRLGLVPTADAAPPGDVRALGGWWVHAPVLESWTQRLRTAVEELHARDPLAAGLSRGAARDLLALPDAALVDPVVRGAGLEQDGGHIRSPHHRGGLGAHETAVLELERRLGAEPFRSPEADDLTALRLGARELAAAERTGRLLRLGDGVVLLPTAPALAMRELARLPQPFTTSQARQALGTSRRVAIPLLEHLDARGWTRRLDAGHRTVAR